MKLLLLVLCYLGVSLAGSVPLFSSGYNNDTVMTSIKNTLQKYFEDKANVQDSLDNFNVNPDTSQPPYVNVNFNNVKLSNLNGCTSADMVVEVADIKQGDYYAWSVVNCPTLTVSFESRVPIIKGTLTADAFLNIQMTVNNNGIQINDFKVALMRKINPDTTDGTNACLIKYAKLQLPGHIEKVLKGQISNALGMRWA